MKYRYDGPQFENPHCLLVPLSHLKRLDGAICLNDGYVVVSPRAWHWLEQNVSEYRKEWCYMQRQIWFHTRRQAMLFKLTFA